MQQRFKRNRVIREANLQIGLFKGIICIKRQAYRTKQSQEQKKGLLMV